MTAHRNSRTVSADERPEATEELLAAGYRLALVAAHDDGDAIRIVSLFLAGMPEDAARARSVLDQVQLGERSSARPAHLSHGEAQRAAVARATVNRPKVLIADEPTSNLDDANCARALDLLEAQAGECGATLVIATHDQRARARFENRLELPQ